MPQLLRVDVFAGQSVGLKTGWRELLRHSRLACLWFWEISDIVVVGQSPLKVVILMQRVVGLECEVFLLHSALLLLHPDGPRGPPPIHLVALPPQARGEVQLQVLVQASERTGKRLAVDGRQHREKRGERRVRRGVGGQQRVPEERGGVAEEQQVLPEVLRQGVLEGKHAGGDLHAALDLQAALHQLPLAGVQALRGGRGGLWGVEGEGSRAGKEERAEIRDEGAIR